LTKYIYIRDCARCEPEAKHLYLSALNIDLVIYEFELQYLEKNDDYPDPDNPLYSELARVAYEWVANSLSVYPNYLSRSNRWQEILIKKIKTLIKEEMPDPIFADYQETLSPEQIAAEHIFWNWIFKRLEMKGGGTRDRQIFIALSEGYTLKNSVFQSHE
ncbi:MAG TPA: hypothetical protein PK957_03535, partial [Candidatus Dojkabacteria bacterium]|nr:hypothetical protein [Candidatus Dojkabacteria bacterium]